ncbi:unnamed protein product [Parajaminaea phylloscopi]
MSATPGFQTPLPHTPARPPASQYFEPQGSASAGKSVRWGDQVQAGTTPASSLVRQTPNQTHQTTQSQIQRVQSQPSSQNQAAGASSSRTLAQSSAKSPSQPPTKAPARSLSVRPSTTALKSRLRWNGAALATLFIAPRMDIVKRTYWSLLDVTYSLAGTGADERVDAVMAWLGWAALIVFLINLGEATVQLCLGSPASDSSVAKPNGLKRPPGWVQMPVVPSPSKAASESQSSPIRYSAHSPLKANLEAAGRTASSPLSSSSRMQRRLPSAPPTGMASNASPLAAYLARRAVSRDASLPSHAADDSDVGGGDLSTDSVEVDRALRALSGDYTRIVSEGSRSIAV